MVIVMSLVYVLIEETAFVKEAWGKRSKTFCQEQSMTLSLDDLEKVIMLHSCSVSDVPQHHVKILMSRFSRRNQIVNKVVIC